MSLRKFVYTFVWGCLALNLHANPLPNQCTQNCVVDFGALVGLSFSGVQAYSNCQNSCVNPAPNFVDQVFTGIKWQCVEYARRWLLLNKGVVYGDVDIAADIWNLEYVHSPDKNKQFKLRGFVNGSVDAGLQRGDLLIYAKAFYGTGHVAVVLQVDAEKQLVYVGEQNYNNDAWQHKYARAIPYIVRDDTTWLLDAYIIGWKRVIN